MNAREEWVGGMVLMPPAADDPSPLVLLLWAQPVTGMVLGLELCRATEIAEHAAPSLLQATRDPKDDQGPRTPATLRVQTPAFAELLRDQIGEIEIVVAPTPELLPIVDALDQKFGVDRNAPTMSTAINALFATTAAELHSLAPWDHVPSDGYFGVHCAELGIDEGAIALLAGANGQGFCLALFRSEDDAVDCMIALDEADEDGPESLPQHITVEWPETGDGAASARMVLPDLSARPLMEGELLGVYAILRTLAVWLREDPKELAAAWDADELSVTRSTRVEVPGGAIEVELGAPLWLETDDLDAEELEAVAQMLEVGTAAGFDMSTEDGVKAFLETTLGKPKKKVAKAKPKAKPAKAKAKPAKKSAKPAKKKKR